MNKVDFAFMDYKSPIEVIAKEIATQFDNDVYRAVQETEIKVDKGELVKALQYDRDQYIKGYADGFANSDKEIAKQIFEEIEDCMSCFEDDDDGYLLKKCEFEFFMRELKKEYIPQLCTDCKHFVGCECFSGQTCDEYTEGETDNAMAVKGTDNEN